MLLAVGRLKSGAEQSLFNRYLDLYNAAARNIRLQPLHLIEISESRADAPPSRKGEEAHELMQRAGSARMIALDEEGGLITSEELTAMLVRAREEAAADLAFAIGGPDGHGDAVLKSAAVKLSLGRLTLPHALARIVLMEQLYRALTIIQGHPYHRV